MAKVFVSHASEDRELTDEVRDRLTDMVQRSTPPAHALVLDLDANDELDITSAEVLEKLIRELGRRQVRLGLAHVHAPAARMLRGSGVMAAVGDDRTLPNLAAAAAWASTSSVDGSAAADGQADAGED
jgi:MFS superfamily sulfate permease-like transporter